MRIHHLALRTLDLDRLRRFYVEVLGLEIAREAEGRVWLRAGDAILMLERAAPREPPIPEGTMELVAFAVTEEERERFARALPENIEDRTERTLYLRDPDGRRVGLSSYRFEIG